MLHRVSLCWHLFLLFDSIVVIVIVVSCIIWFLLSLHLLLCIDMSALISSFHYIMFASVSMAF